MRFRLTLAILAFAAATGCAAPPNSEGRGPGLSPVKLMRRTID